MGVHLNAALRDDVVFIGTVHGEMTDSVAFGEYWSQAGALAQKLAPQGHEVLMLDVRPEPWPAEESEWWTSPQPFDLGWAKPRLEPATAFDVWVYFDRLTPHRSWQ